MFPFIPFKKNSRLRVLSCQLGSVAFLPFLLSGCLIGSEPDTHPARVTVEMEVEAPEVLCKGAVVVLKQIRVRMVSSARDTLYDVITEDGSMISKDPDTFLAGTVASQVISARYDLAPGRTWTITAHLFDERDSLRQADSLKVTRVASFENRKVAMCLHPRLTAYSAHFFLPSAIQVRETSGHDAESKVGVRRVFFTRINLMDGNVITEDSTAVAGKGSGFQGGDPALLRGSEQSVFFPSGNFGEVPTVDIQDEYVNTGIHTFTLNAYGYIEGDTVGVTPIRLLFKGAQELNTTLAKEAGAVSMEWQATDITVPNDTTSNARVRVILGHVGTIIVNVRMSGELDL